MFIVKIGVLYNSARLIAITTGSPGRRNCCRIMPPNFVQTAIQYSSCLRCFGFGGHKAIHANRIWKIPRCARQHFHSGPGALHFRSGPGALHFRSGPGALHFRFGFAALYFHFGSGACLGNLAGKAPFWCFPCVFPVPVALKSLALLGSFWAGASRATPEPKASKR